MELLVLNVFTVFHDPFVIAVFHGTSEVKIFKDIPLKLLHRADEGPTGVTHLVYATTTKVLSGFLTNVCRQLDHILALRTQEFLNWKVDTILHDIFLFYYYIRFVDFWKH